MWLAIQIVSTDEFFNVILGGNKQKLALHIVRYGCLTVLFNSVVVELFLIHTDFKS